MSKILSFGLVCAAVFATSASAADEVLNGDVVLDPNSGSIPESAEVLFQGDLGAEFGIGCSNGLGTSGGPNDIAVGVTAPIAAPFDITSHFYNIFTQISPNITALTFAAWGGGGAPGAVIGVQAGLDFSQGDHTVAIAPAISVGSAQFYFGHVQPQTDVGMRWGVDSSSGSAGTSFIRAPTCGLNAWGTLDSIGFPGNWVMSATVEDGGSTPVELKTWGEVKALYQ